jgi:hypothetical protein
MAEESAGRRGFWGGGRQKKRSQAAVLSASEAFSQEGLLKISIS